MTIRSSAMFTIAIILLAGSQERAAAADVIDAGNYIHPQRLVAVEHSRRLNLFCSGTGSPVVILDSGTGGDSVDWRLVQGAIARTTQVCSYDRAGYGFSDPGRRRMDASNSVDDLHRLIAAADLSKPIVLVAHSIAGLYATLFAQRYPAEVAGMVLVDPATRGGDNPYLDGLTTAKAAEGLAGERGVIQAAKLCLDLARRHDVTAMRNARPACLDDPPNSDPVLHYLLDRQYASDSFYEANYSEIRDEFPVEGDFSVDDRELSSQAQNFGNMPLVVLTAGIQHLPFTDFTKRDAELVFKAGRDGHIRLAAASTQGREVLVPDSGHYIQNDKPEVVIGYINSVLEATRGARGVKN